MDYLVYSYKYHDKLLLEDLVWIDLENEPKIRNNFNKLNGKFLGDLIWENENELKEFIKSDPKWFIKQLKNINKL